jgi:hypothetical protein
VETAKKLGVVTNPGPPSPDFRRFAVEPTDAAAGVASADADRKQFDEVRRRSEEFAVAGLRDSRL